MATLESLSICGIRSFGHHSNEKQKIKFDKPLTLIQGENGCGKSTIIEALRYVTAQKDPGKGVFVRDPQYSHPQNTIKGFIKLKLRDQRGYEVHLARSLQATRTAKTLSTKQLDSTFSREDPVTREIKSISNRCMDFTPEALRVFGVSKAIIENVIFCTQEDSMWPLDTDQKLKEKFDQIFDSDKYNKCTKKLRDKRKKLMDDKKRFETELKYLKENKDAAASKRSQVQKLESNVEKLNEEIEKLKSDLIPIEQGLKDILMKERELSAICTKRETAKANLQSAANSVRELQNKIKLAACEFAGSDFDLDMAIKECAENAKCATVLKEELSATDDKEKSVSRQIRTSAGQIGELRKLCEMNSDKIAEKGQKMKALANDLDLDSSNITVDCLDRTVGDKESKLNEIRHQLESEEDKKQQEIDKSKELVFTQEAIVKQKNNALVDNRNEAKKVKNEIDDVEASQARLDRVSASLRKATAELAEHQRLNNADDLKSEVRRWQSDLNQAEETLTEVENDVQTLQEQSSVMREIELQREAHAEKTSEARRLRNRHEDTLIEILGNVPESGLRLAVSSRMDTMSRQIKDLQTQQSQKEKEVATLEEKRKHLKSVLRSKQQEVQELSDKVLEETGGDEWEHSVQEQQKVVDELQDTKGTLSSSSCMYQRYIRALQRTKPCCPLCNRDFAAEEEAKNLADELAAKMRDVPNRIRENQRSLDEKQEKLNKLLALQSVQERIAALRSEIPSTEGELETIEGTLLRLRRELNEITSQKQRPEKSLETCASIQSDLTLLDQATTDAWKINLEVERLESRIPATSPKMTLREAQAKQENLRHERKLARHKLEEAQQRLQKFNETLQLLQNNKHSLAEEMRTIEGGGSSRRVLEERYNELLSLEGIIRSELQEAKDAVNPLEQKRSSLINELKQLKEKHKRDLEVKRKEIDVLRKKLDEIHRLQSEISSFQHRGYDRKLTEFENNLCKLEEEAKSLKEQKESLSSKIGDMSKNEVRRRELEDNKSFRDKKAEKSKLEEELSKLEASIGGDTGIDQILREKKRLKNEEEMIGQKKAASRARIGALSAQIITLNEELKSKTYAKIDETYKKTLIEKTLCDCMAEDLLRYSVCMEFAMATYHKTQMEKVNASARELWRTTYQGNDIDYIQILTEECSVTDRRRSYTYRLVQAKGDVRMDMRNRCSAGQKMLAALIIRMALAHVFSGSCGILTLDEPTTNLDSKNVRNLARTLSNLISDRETATHSNFQLIVITHDEQFVRELLETNATQTCVRVSRDQEGKSRITLRRIDRGIGSHEPEDEDRSRR